MGAKHAIRHAQRFEVSGETVFCYGRRAPLLLELQQHPTCATCIARELEDVFLKLTDGRCANDFKELQYGVGCVSAPSLSSSLNLPII